MPSASVAIATNVNPGDLASWRKASFRDMLEEWLRLFRTQCDERIDFRRATSGQEGCAERGDGEDETRDEKTCRIGRACFVEHRGQNARSGERAGQSEDRAK